MSIRSCQFLPFCLLICQFLASQTHPTRINDSSDWWSWLGQEENPNGPELKSQKRTLAEASFQIAGVTLGGKEFETIQLSLGKAVEVQRGDGASSRHQICYVSPSGDVHFVLEHGEIDSVAYLFAAGPKWNGDQFCRSSPQVSDLSTGSGLRLGISPEKVKEILGQPSVSSLDTLIYSFEFREKTSAEGLAQLRKHNPNMSDKEFREIFDSGDVSAYLKARFDAGKLSYMAISRSETY